MSLRSVSSFITAALVFLSVVGATTIQRNPEKPVPIVISNESSGASSFTNVYWPIDSPVAAYLPPLNATSHNVSTVGAPQYSCNGALYGRNLNLASCNQVWRLMSEDMAMETYGQRGEGKWRQTLPFRYLSKDGLCAIDISHSARANHDQMRPGDMKQVVRVLIDVCVRGNPNQGGIASNLGVHGNLAVRVVPYRPKVICGAPGSGAPWISCRDIIDEMPADGEQTVFGPKDDPETKVPIPFVLTTRAQRCSLWIKSQTHGVEVKDTYDWYKMWAAASAVDFMCTLSGRAGKAYDLGEFHTFATITGLSYQSKRRMLMATFDEQDKGRSFNSS